MDAGIVTTYTWVCRTREILWHALDQLGPEAYRAPQATLAGDSIRDRHIHIASCYIFWAARVGLGEDLAEPSPADFADAAASRAAFATADAAVERLLTHFDGHLDDPIERTVWGQAERLTPRWLLMHPVTHEFNHKGQILILVRMFGAPPFDGDMARPFGAPPAQAPDLTVGGRRRAPTADHSR